MKKLLFILAVAVLLCTTASAQTEPQELTIEQDSVAVNAKPRVIDPLAPSKAAFYSAIVPGLGQVYNKKYWKVPLVYGGMAISLYYYSWNNREYHRYRDAYKDNLAGRPVTGELDGIDPDRLIRAQRFHQRNRDLSMLITVAIYILNVVDANVDAHLMQFNVDENLTLRPQLQQNNIDFKRNMGLSLTYTF